MELTHTITNHGPVQIEVTHFGVKTLLDAGAAVICGTYPDNIRIIRDGSTARFEVVPDKGAGKTLEELLEAALRRLVKANAGLAKIKSGLTLYEISPTKDQDAYEAWLELNDSLKQAKTVFLAIQIKNGPDEELTAGPEITP